MNTVSNDTEFRSVIAGLDPAGQRALAARFLANVLPLCGDDAHIIHVSEVASRPDVSDSELTAALHEARTVAVEMHNRCGAECNWRDQAGYFVARAALAAVSPADQLPGGPAWQTAMSSRMARTCESIELAADMAGNEQQAQYRILSEFIDTQREVS